MSNSTKIYGGVVVRLSDRLMLCKAMGCPMGDFSIPGNIWAEIISKCQSPHFRTSSFISLNSTSDTTEEEEKEGENSLQLSYHIMTDHEIGFALLAEKTVSRRQGHLALDEISKTFRKMFVENILKLNTKTVDVFVKTFRDLMLRFSEYEDSEDKIKKVKKVVNEVKDMALDNVERVIQRGQRIEEIVQSTEDLQFQAQGFHRSSRDLRQQLWWNSIKGKLIFGSVVVFFIIIVLFVFFS